MFVQHVVNTTTQDVSRRVPVVLASPTRHAVLFTFWITIKAVHMGLHMKCNAFVCSLRVVSRFSWLPTFHGSPPSSPITVRSRAKPGRKLYL